MQDSTHNDSKSIVGHIYSQRLVMKKIGTCSKIFETNSQLKETKDHQRHGWQKDQWSQLRS
jgi:hypothetical protein